MAVVAVHLGALLLLREFRAAMGASMNQVMHVYRVTGLKPLDVRPESDDPDDVEERQSTLIRMPVTAFGDAVRSGVVRDARTIAAVRPALD